MLTLRSQLITRLLMKPLLCGAIASNDGKDV